MSVIHVHKSDIHLVSRNILVHMNTVPHCGLGLWLLKVYTLYTMLMLR